MHTERQPSDAARAQQFHLKWMIDSNATPFGFLHGNKCVNRDLLNFVRTDACMRAFRWPPDLLQCRNPRWLRITMTEATGLTDCAERPFLLMVLGILGMLGCASLVIGALVAQSLVPTHDWIADTISDLGAGRLDIIMDFALYGFAAGLMATALAASHAHLGGKAWSTGVLSLAVLAALVIIVGARDEYGDGDVDGVVIHIYLVYGLGALFLLTPLCMAADINNEHGWAKRALIALGILWGIAAPVFLFVPTSIDGLVERFLGVVACAIVMILSWIFYKRGRSAYRKLE